MLERLFLEFFEKKSSEILVERKKVVLLQPVSPHAVERRPPEGRPEGRGSRPEPTRQERGAGRPVKEFIEIL